jgi:hypothetical protein
MAVISSPHSFYLLPGTVHVPPPPPPLHRGGRRPRPAADPRGPNGVRRPRRLRHPPSPRRRAPPLRAAPRLPPLSIAAPRGDRSSRPLPPTALGMNLTVLGSGVLQLPQEEARGGARLERGLLLLQRCLQGARQGDEFPPISLEILA